MENNLNNNVKKLRRGITTGTCAAAAAKAAAELLLLGNAAGTVNIIMPSGDKKVVAINSVNKTANKAIASVIKDAGDDPDVTNGMEIFVTAECTASGVEICGGEGVGVVTQKGLNRPVGDYAINSVPRRMIAAGVLKVMDIAGYKGGLKITVSVPGGEEIAKRTFNPRLGIEGGISILGTTGIVEPMSLDAVKETIRLELNQKRTTGTQNLLITPGNYGKKFIKNSLEADWGRAVKCSNFIGEAIDMAADMGFGAVLLVSHIGKAVKLGCGIMNTHSNNGDARAEMMAACAVYGGCGINEVKRILSAVTTDDMLEIMGENRSRAMEYLTERIDFYIKKRGGQNLETGFIVFSDKYGILCKSDNALRLLEKIEEESGDTV